MSTWDRCITRGVPRIIPVTDRAHIDDDVALWTGDARARWEGDTLVVDTTAGGFVAAPAKPMSDREAATMRLGGATGRG